MTTNCPTASNQRKTIGARVRERMEAAGAGSDEMIQRAVAVRGAAALAPVRTVRPELVHVVPRNRPELVKVAPPQGASFTTTYTASTTYTTSGSSTAEMQALLEKVNSLENIVRDQAALVHTLSTRQQLMEGEMREVSAEKASFAEKIAWLEATPNGDEKVGEKIVSLEAETDEGDTVHESSVGAEFEARDNLYGMCVEFVSELPTNPSRARNYMPILAGLQLVQLFFAMAFFDNAWLEATVKTSAPAFGDPVTQQRFFTKNHAAIKGVPTLQPLAGTASVIALVAHQFCDDYQTLAAPSSQSLPWEKISPSSPRGVMFAFLTLIAFGFIEISRLIRALLMPTYVMMGAAMQFVGTAGLNRRFLDYAHAADRTFLRAPPRTGYRRQRDGHCAQLGRDDFFARSRRHVHQAHHPERLAEMGGKPPAEQEPRRTWGFRHDRTHHGAPARAQQLRVDFFGCATSARRARLSVPRLGSMPHIHAQYAVAPLAHSLLRLHL